MKLISVLLILCMLLIPTALADEASPGWEQSCAGLLDQFYRLTSGTEDDQLLPEGAGGVREAVMFSETGEALSSIGYAVRDLSGDGIPELMIGYIDETDETGSRGSEIYSVFSFADGEPVLALEGWARSSYRLMNDGRSFCYQGSGGAIYAIFGEYTLSADGTELICTDYYFTCEKDESFEEIVMYHNTTGEWDKSVSEELDMTLEEFWQLQDDFASQAVPVEWIPFSLYPETGVPAFSASAVRIGPADELLASCNAYSVFIADRSEWQSQIALIANETVTDFRLFSLSLSDDGQTGSFAFDSAELYYQPELTPDRPLEVRLTFYGDVPAYGISYVDSEGILCSFAIEVSGKDGTLLLTGY